MYVPRIERPDAPVGAEAPLVPPSGAPPVSAAGAMLQCYLLEIFPHY
jgi:hypothetical protein